MFDTDMEAGVAMKGNDSRPRGPASGVPQM